MRTWLAVTAMLLAIAIVQETSFAAEMALPGNPPKPQLVARCNSRMMSIGDHKAFMDELVKWMSTCVTSRTINPKTGKPYQREYELVNKAFPDIQAIYEYAKRLPQFPGVRVQVNAEYVWGRLLNGTWWVRGVHFWIIGRQLPPAPPEPPDPRVWTPVFVPDRTTNYTIDIRTGNTIVNAVKNAAYQEAKKEAALLKNPVSTPSGKDLFDTFQDLAKGGEIPFLDMGKMAIGSLLQAVINGQAGDVARVRRAAYFFFAAGFVQVIALQSPAQPKTVFGRKYYELGQKEAGKLTPQQQYQVQMSLLYYASQNPTSGWRIPQPQDWKFPDDYARNWSPERLTDALYNQLYRTKYSVD